MKFCQAQSCCAAGTGDIAVLPPVQMSISHLNRMGDGIFSIRKSGVARNNNSFIHIFIAFYLFFLSFCNIPGRAHGSWQKHTRI